MNAQIIVNARPPQRPSTRPLARASARVLLLLAIAGVTLLGACESGPKPRARPSDSPAVLRDVPQVFRQTVGAQCTLRGTETILVSGFGLVVGLNNTGGGPLPVQIQSTMERELAMGGIGKGGLLESGPLAKMTPRQVLADKRVAVVLVQGVISPGSPLGSVFDVRVSTLPGSSVTSLEGGQLWSTEMRLGPASPFGSMRSRKLAEAGGPVFLNPFALRDSATGPSAKATPNASESTADDGVTRTVGRVMDGGRVTDPLVLELLLDSPSHARASSIVAAVNTAFPNGPGDEALTARGRNDQSVAVRVPRAFRDKSAEFVKLLQYVPIESAFVDEYAKRYTDELRENTALTEDLSWALVALGKPAIPFLQPLYDAPELLPRLAALRAGAKLGDMRAVPYLRAMAGATASTSANAEAASNSGPAVPNAMRGEAIVLLGEMPFNPTIDVALRELLNAPSLETRIAAYEALAKRQDPVIDRTRIEGRFTLDIVPSREELVYVTQQGEPRIVVFGNDVRVNTFSLVSTWKDRFMLMNDGKLLDGNTDRSRPVRLYYRDVNPMSTGVKANVPDRLGDLIKYLGRKPQFDDPATGLGLSYSQVVGVLSELQRQRGVDAPFTTEENRLIARLNEAEGQLSLPERPESEAKRAESKNKVIVIRPGSGSGIAYPGERPAPGESLAIPIKRDPQGDQKKTKTP